MQNQLDLTLKKSRSLIHYLFILAALYFLWMAVELTSKEDLLERAIDIFGITKDPFEAGYILKDGSMLDFSGKKIGGSPGMRELDHRDIWQVFEEDDDTLHGMAAMDAFIIFTNSIRMGVYTRRSPSMQLSLEVRQNVTALQRKKLISIVKHYNIQDICYEIYGVQGSMLSRGCTIADLRSAIPRILDEYLKLREGL